MATCPPHIAWFIHNGEKLQTSDGKDVVVVEFKHLNDAAAMSAWAKHFREQYCLDEHIDEMRDGTGLSRGKYLAKYVFPDNLQGLGPSIRSGDFAEVLIADYFQFVHNWKVPRTRNRFKPIPNESTKGTDLLGFSLASTTDISTKKYSPEDVLLTVEIKAQLSGNVPKHRLQEAITDSIKDNYRRGLALNAMRQRLHHMHDEESVELVKRFQTPEDHSYRIQTVATAVHSTSNFDSATITTASTAGHPDSATMWLMVVRGEDLMTLVHALYEVATNEA
jgi:hypothetical protein